MLNNAPRLHADLIGIAFYLLPDLQIVELFLLNGEIDSGQSA
jgi:hypothetical protein